MVMLAMDGVLRMRMVREFKHRLRCSKPWAAIAGSAVGPRRTAALARMTPLPPTPIIPPTNPPAYTPPADGRTPWRRAADGRSAAGPRRAIDHDSIRRRIQGSRHPRAAGRARRGRRGRSVPAVPTGIWRPSSPRRRFSATCGCRFLCASTPATISCSPSSARSAARRCASTKSRSG